MNIDYRKKKLPDADSKKSEARSTEIILVSPLTFMYFLIPPVSRSLCVIVFTSLRLKLKLSRRNLQNVSIKKEKREREKSISGEHILQLNSSASGNSIGGSRRSREIKVSGNYGIGHRRR